MKVICTVNNVSTFLGNKKIVDRLRKYIFTLDGEDDDLSISKEYTVYGIVFRDNAPWYYLCPNDHEACPYPFAADFFYISDERLSTCWTLITNESDEGIVSSLAFKEWSSQDADGRSFYERLLDDVEEEILLFKKYKKLMDEEFS